MSAMQWSTIEDAIHDWIAAGSGLANDHVIWADQGGPRPVGPYIAMRLSVMQRGRDWLDRVDKILAVATQAITAVNPGADTFTIPAHGLVTGDGDILLTTTGTTPGGTAIATRYWAVVVDANTIKIATTFQNAIATVPVVVDITSSGTGTTSINGTPTTARAGQEIELRLRGPRQGVLDLQCFAGAPTPSAATGNTNPRALLHDAIAAYALESRQAALAAAGVGVGSVEEVRSIPPGVVDITVLEPRAVSAVHLHLASELVETATYIQIVNVENDVVSPPQTFPVRLP